MKNQQGFALSKLLFGAIIFVLLAVLGTKTVPVYIQYFQLKKTIQYVAAAAEDQTVDQLRTSFSKAANVNYLNDVSPEDLDITKNDGVVVIKFAYEKRVPLFYNVSLLFQFKGSSSERSAGR